MLTILYQELIYGPFQQGSDDYVGRGKDKFFLYEIVANKTNSIDVDKVSLTEFKSWPRPITMIFAVGLHVERRLSSFYRGYL